MRLLTPLLLLLSSSVLADEAVLVTVQPLKELVVYPEDSAPAEVVSLNRSQLSAQVSAVVSELPVQVGEAVEQDVLLVRLECSDYQLAQGRVQATLEGVVARRRLAEYRLRKARALAKSSNVSEELLVRREVELATLKADIRGQETALEVARKNVARCAIRAPYFGVVLKRNAQLGELAAVGQPLIELQQTGKVEVVARIPSRHLWDVRSASQFYYQSHGARRPVNVRALVPRIDGRTHAQEGRFIFLDASAPPGSVGRLVWRQAAPALSANLLERRGGALGLFLARDGKAQFHPLPEAQEGRPATVTLPLESEVIVAGRINVSDGAAIRIKP